MQKAKQYIDLQKLDKLCKGDQVKKVNYLNQFIEIVAPNYANLETAFEANDFPKFRKTLHFITPNLVFFGLTDIPQLLGTLEKESDSEASDSLNKEIQDGIYKIEKAIAEVEQLIASMTKNDLNED